MNNSLNFDQIVSSGISFVCWGHLWFEFHSSHVVVCKLSGGCWKSLPAYFGIFLVWDTNVTCIHIFFCSQENIAKNSDANDVKNRGITDISHKLNPKFKILLKIWFENLIPSQNLTQKCGFFKKIFLPPCSKRENSFEYIAVRHYIIENLNKFTSNRNRSVMRTETSQRK